MKSWQILHQELGQLAQEAKCLKAQGAITYPADFVLDTSISRGHVYHRRRIRKEDGKPGKAEIISAELYSKLNQQLRNGRRIHQIETQIADVTAKLDAIARKAEAMGLSLPDL